MTKKYIIIMGGEMCNKGAQAMLFTSINELKSRFGDTYEILVLSNEDYKQRSSNLFQFKFQYMRYFEEWYLAGGAFRFISQIKCKSKIKRNLQHIRELYQMFKHAYFCIDISGFALSSQWGVKHSAEFLVRFSLLKQFNVPSYIMPQSFGPLNFGNIFIDVFMRFLIRRFLSYPNVIYAREEEGYQLLAGILKPGQVKRSDDLVLQNKGMTYNYIYRQVPPVREYIIPEGSTAIIPNYRNVDYGNKEELMNLYLIIVAYLLKRDRSIYLIYHSNEDLILNKEIKKHFDHTDRVVVIEEELNCFEYEDLIKKFDFVVASRFHSIVHAYKQNIPCIVLGWAVKYDQLLKNFEQDYYMLDVRKTIEPGEIMDRVKKMTENHKMESKVIAGHLKNAQEKNCFDILDI